MIRDIPTSQDFFESGIELFDFAWDTVAALLTNLSEAEELGIDPAEVSAEYWAAAKRRLSTALAMTQQGRGCNRIFPDRQKTKAISVPAMS